MRKIIITAFVKTKGKFCVRTFAFLTHRMVTQNVMQSGYEIFISNQGPQRYYKCISDIGEYEARNLGFAVKSSEILNVPAATIKTFYYQRLISFIFIRPQIRRSIIVAQYFNKPIVFPLKRDWIEIFEKNGFRFQKRTSIALWKLFNVTLILKQLVQYITFFFSYIPKRNSHKISSQENSYKKIFFYDFPPGSLLSDDNGLHYKNSIAWIKKNMQGNSGLVAFSKYGSNCQNSDHVKLNNIYGDILIRKELIIIFKLLIFISKNLKNFKNIGLLFLNLNELLEFNRILCYRKKIIVNEVYFNCSLGATKPLWAYAAEKIGIENYLLFYATYTEPRFEVDQVQLGGEWRLATWKNYIVPDLFLKSELESLIPKVNQKFYVLGLAWWVDCKDVLDDEMKPVVVIFDKPPHNSLYLFSLLAMNGCDTHDYQEKFLSDILKVYKDLDCLILYKSKRPSDDFRYNQFIARMKLEYSENFRVINEEYAPIRLMENASVVISRAGSSTAFIANTEGKNSIIYDPAGIVNPNDPSYRGIRVIQNVVSLKNYVAQF